MWSSYSGLPLTHPSKSCARPAQVLSNQSGGGGGGGEGGGGGGAGVGAEGMSNPSGCGGGGRGDGGGAGDGVTAYDTVPDGPKSVSTGTKASTGVAGGVSALKTLLRPFTSYATGVSWSSRALATSTSG